MENDRLKEEMRNMELTIKHLSSRSPHMLFLPETSPIRSPASILNNNQDTPQLNITSSGRSAEVRTHMPNNFKQMKQSESPQKMMPISLIDEGTQQLQIVEDAE